MTDRAGRRAVALFVLAASGCAPGLEADAWTRGTLAVDLSGGRLPAPVTMTYLGVGGWLIETPRTRLLTAPLFSNPSLWRAGFATIDADTAAIAEGLRRFGADDLSDVAAILSGHAHYDHLMDVPWIAGRRAPDARIVVNTTGARTLAPILDRWEIDPARVLDVTDAAADLEGGGRWFSLGPDLRMLPLRSDHAPHFAGMTLYGGERAADLPTPPAAADEWLEGRTLAFLIEVLDVRGDVALRLYVQDAVAREPWGFVPAGTDSVDVAILVPATYAEVDWHPEAVLENTRARHVLLGHWENLFEPPSADPEPVPFTLLPDFVARLRRALDGDDGRWTLPVPGARVVIR
ncbi:MAG: hypothetical protein RLN75_03865 [Longimicrobiales bacterium]